MEQIYLDKFTRSLERLREILAAEQTIANRDSSIKRFEFTVELAWKTVQKFLSEEKIICRSPKECLQNAFQFGLISDDPRWLKMLDDRNLTAHTYDEETADAVYARLSGYLILFDALHLELQARLAKNS